MRHNKLCPLKIRAKAIRRISKKIAIIIIIAMGIQARGARNYLRRWPHLPSNSTIRIWTIIIMNKCKTMRKKTKKVNKWVTVDCSREEMMK